MTHSPTEAISAFKAAPAPDETASASLFRLPRARINWTTSSFLIGTLVLTLTAVPAYLWFFGIDWFQIALFCVMFAACGFSISIGYHRLFSHTAFQDSILPRSVKRPRLPVCRYELPRLRASPPSLGEESHID